MPVQMLPTTSRAWPAGLDARAAADMAGRPINPPVQSRIDPNERLIRELERTRKALARSRLKDAQAEEDKPWIRRCEICKAPAGCIHREPELVEAWKK